MRAYMSFHQAHRRLIEEPSFAYEDLLLDFLVLIVRQRDNPPQSDQLLGSYFGHRER